MTLWLKVVPRLCVTLRSYSSKLTRVASIVIKVAKSAMGKKGCELALEVQNIVVGVYQQGQTGTKIAELLNISRSASYVIHKCRRSWGVENSKRSVRRGLVNELDNRQFQRTLKRNWQAAVSEIAARFVEGEDRQVSERTVKRRL